MALDILGRLISLLSIPLNLLMIFSMIRMVRKEQRARPRSNLVGIIMAPLALLVNIVFLNQALFDSFGTLLAGMMLGVFGLGFGLAWGQTAKLYHKDEQLVVKRSILHLVFWGSSYAITQLLAAFAPAVFVAGGLAAMFFSTGSTVGTNTNMLLRQKKFKREKAIA